MTLGKRPTVDLTSMLQFEIDCNDGKGNAVACHQVGEFLSVVKNNHEKAAQVFKKNCDEFQHPASCFNLGRILRKSLSLDSYVDPVEAGTGHALSPSSGGNPSLSLRLGL